MKLTIIFLFSIISIAMCVKPEFQKFKEKFNKKYKDANEENKRRVEFTKNVKKINAHNAKFVQKLSSFTMGVNDYTDMSLEEFAEKYGQAAPDIGSLPVRKRRKATRLTRASRKRKPIKGDLPASVDHGAVGCAGTVQYQGACGSCWSFVATGVLETARCLEVKKLPPSEQPDSLPVFDLSEQNLIDCTLEKYGYNNLGCSGGYTHDGWQYVMDNGGMNTEDQYTYTGLNSPTCDYKLEDIDFYVSGYTQLPKSEAALQEALVKGPVSASGIPITDEFKQYSSGVLDVKRCSRKGYLYHALVLLGYGDDAGKEFYIAKNSWGTSWGEGGYIRMSRNKRNQCEIASYAETVDLYLKPTVRK